MALAADFHPATEEGQRQNVHHASDAGAIFFDHAIDVGWGREASSCSLQLQYCEGKDISRRFMFFFLAH